MAFAASALLPSTTTSTTTAAATFLRVVSHAHLPFGHVSRAHLVPLRLQPRALLAVPAQQALLGALLRALGGGHVVMRAPPAGAPVVHDGAPRCVVGRVLLARELPRQGLVGALAEGEARVGPLLQLPLFAQLREPDSVVSEWVGFVGEERGGRKYSNTIRVNLTAKDSGEIDNQVRDTPPPIPPTYRWMSWPRRLSALDWPTVRPSDLALCMAATSAATSSEVVSMPACLYL